MNKLAIIIMLFQLTVAGILMFLDAPEYSTCVMVAILVTDKLYKRLEK